MKKTTGKFSTTNNGSRTDDGENVLSSTDEKIAAPFLKMKKLGIPEKALRHKMITEDVPQHIIDSILPSASPPKLSEPQGSSRPPPSSPSPPPSRETQSELPVTSEPVVHENRLINDGKSQKILAV